MVDAFGCARITDFGLAQDQRTVEETEITSVGTARWTAPEILEDKGTLSKEADVFSFAMVMVEVSRDNPMTTGGQRTTNHLYISIKVFTGAAPFDLQPSIAATVAIMQRGRPPRPTHPTLTDELWRLMQHCWNQEPHLRLEMSEVLQVLYRQLAPFVP